MYIYVARYLSVCLTFEHSVDCPARVPDWSRCGHSYGNCLLYIRNNEDQSRGKHSGNTLENVAPRRSVQSSISGCMYIDADDWLYQAYSTSGACNCGIVVTNVIYSTFGQGDVRDESHRLRFGVGFGFQCKHFQSSWVNSDNRRITARLYRLICPFVCLHCYRN